MSYASGGGWDCDGCRRHMPLDGPTPTLHWPDDDSSPKHFHHACWETGWYNGIEPKGEWPIDEAPEPSFNSTSINPFEVRTTSSTGGQKGVKPARFDLIPVGPLTQVATLYGQGAAKYEDRNWERGYEWSKSYAALMRHVTQFWGGEDIDADSGQPHMAAVVFHALALLEFMERHRSFDDRPVRDNGNNATVV